MIARSAFGICNPASLTIDTLAGRRSKAVLWLENAGRIMDGWANAEGTGLAGPEGPEPDKPSPPSAASLSQGGSDGSR